MTAVGWACLAALVLALAVLWFVIVTRQRQADAATRRRKGLSR